MKYFIDTEFIAGFRETCIRFPFNWKREHFIDLISIGIVAEDGRTYYAISNEYNYNDADAWVKKNVIEPMYLQMIRGDMRNRHSVHNFHKFFGLPNKMIADEIKQFVYKGADVTHIPQQWGKEITFEFYGYYADYDWVLFCSLFGRMIDLPKGFPMYCKDLKQMLDEKVDKSTLAYYGADLKGGGAHENFEGKLKLIKAHIDYPKQQNEHNALADAKWNYELYKFIQSL